MEDPYDEEARYEKRHARQDGRRFASYNGKRKIVGTKRHSQQRQRSRSMRLPGSPGREQND